MSSYSTNEFKGGLKVMMDGYPYSIMENEYVKPGKGQAFNRVRMRNLKTGRVLEKTFKSGDTLEGADVVDVEMQYLYNDGEYYHFMNPTSFEQIAADPESVSDTAKWLKEQDVCVITLWTGVPLTVAGSGGKPARLVGGAVVKVPLFINVGDVLKVDTRNGEYVGRA